MKLIKEYLTACLKERTAGIFGTGKMAHTAEEFLEEINLKEYVYFDNDLQKAGTILNGKMIFDPRKITKEHFIFISTVYFSDIKRQLGSIGLKELQDYIWVLDLEYYEGLLRCKNAPKVPEISFQDLERLEEELEKYVEVEKIGWFDEQEFEAYERRLMFSEEYHKSENKRYRRKIMEYYCAEKLLKFETWKKDEIYVDVGACGSPFAKYLRERKKINAWAMDLEKGKYDELPYYIQEDATRMHFDDGEVSAISLQSAFEMFLKNGDSDLLREAGRVLRVGGKFIVLPLYMHNQYLSTVSPNYYHTGTADEGSLECIRLDCRGGLPMARFYSVSALKERILGQAAKCGLRPKVYSLPQSCVEKDEFVYLKFILCMEKE